MNINGKQTLRLFSSLLWFIPDQLPISEIPDQQGIGNKKNSVVALFKLQTRSVSHSFNKNNKVQKVTFRKEESVNSEGETRKVVDYIANPTKACISFLEASIREDDSRLSYSTVNKEVQSQKSLFLSDEDKVIWGIDLHTICLQGESRRPKNGMQLMEAFIEYGRERRCGMRTDDDLPLRYPGGGGRKFALSLEHPSVDQVIAGTMSIRGWIESRLVQPGIAVSNMRLTASQKTCLINAVRSDLIPRELHAKYQSLVNGDQTTFRTVYSYCRRMIETVSRTFSRHDAEFKSFIANRLTAILMDKVLPTSSKNLICDSAAHLACTESEEDSVSRTHFVCFFDPVLKEVALGTLDASGTFLRPLDKELWVHFVPWEQYGVALNPTLGDHRITLHQSDVA